MTTNWQWIVQNHPECPGFAIYSIAYDIYYQERSDPGGVKWFPHKSDAQKYIDNMRQEEGK